MARLYTKIGYARSVLLNIRFPSVFVASILGLGLALASAPLEAQIPTDVETYEYTVQEGDTCAAIAGRAFGNRRRYDIIHLYNPNMGPPPHSLEPGSTLTLPRNTGPDARVTAVRREVQARQPSDTDWRSASRGLGLFRGWRVNTLEESTAELTFQDDSRVHMRENTLVIIYGGSDEPAVSPRLARSFNAAHFALTWARSAFRSTRLEAKLPSRAATRS